MRTKKVLFLLLLLVSISFTTGCLESLFNNKPIIGSIPETTAKVGIEYTYEIEATDPDADDVLIYSLTEKPTGMTINTSTGAVSWTPTEAQVGEHQVTIEVSDGKVSVSQTFTITVAEALLSSIVVVPSEMSVPIGSSETITSITAYYDNNTDTSINLSSVTYSSNHTNIATVNASGEVTGVSAGTATITVSYTESYTEEDDITKTDTITVTVPPNLNFIKVLPEFMIIYKGSSQSITSIKAYYVGSTTPADIALSDASYDVDSTDTPDIITVNTSGVVTGVTASDNWQAITVSYTEGSITKTDMVYVKVEPAPKVLTSLTVIPSAMEIAVGGTETIVNITAGYSNATAEGKALGDCTYISSNPLVATVDTGVINAIAVGTATITVGYTENGITETDTVAVTVVVAE
jgi:uncharacterized protein YjdB